MKAPVNTDNWSGSIKSDKAPLNTDDWNGFISPELAKQLSTQPVEPKHPAINILKPLPKPNFEDLQIVDSDKMNAFIEQKEKEKKQRMMYFWVGVLVVGGFIAYKKFKK